jgi:hypothetical protein
VTLGVRIDCDGNDLAILPQWLRDKHPSITFEVNAVAGTIYLTCGRVRVVRGGSWPRGIVLRLAADGMDLGSGYEFDNGDRVIISIETED